MIGTSENPTSYSGLQGAVETKCYRLSQSGEEKVFAVVTESAEELWLQETYRVHTAQALPRSPAPLGTPELPGGASGM